MEFNVSLRAMTHQVTYRIWLLALAIVVGLSACENDIKKVAALNHHTDQPEEAHGVDAYFHQGSVLKARLTAPYMLRYNDTLRTVFPNSLHCDFYDSLQHIESRMDARYGIYHENTNQVYLRDSVVILNLTKRDTIYCKDLYWDQNTGVFTTHKEVQIHRVGQFLQGKGMTSTQDFSHASIDTLYNSTVQVQEGKLQ
jgi:LPS export ABC transporter protein LptC